MRGILINPYTKCIGEVRVRKNDIQTIYDAMSWLSHKISIIEIGMTFANSDNLLLDEEGLLFPGRQAWKLNGNPFVGCGLLLGCDKEGEWDNVKTGLVDMQTYVQWSDMVTAGVV